MWAQADRMRLPSHFYSPPADRHKFTHLTLAPLRHAKKVCALCVDFSAISARKSPCGQSVMHAKTMTSTSASKRPVGLHSGNGGESRRAMSKKEGDRPGELRLSKEADCMCWQFLSASRRSVRWILSGHTGHIRQLSPCIQCYEADLRKASEHAINADSGMVLLL